MNLANKDLVKTGLGTWQLNAYLPNSSEPLLLELSEKNADGSLRDEPSAAFLIILEKLVEDLPRLKIEFIDRIEGYSLADNILEQEDEVLFVKQFGFEVTVGEKVDQKIIDFLTERISVELVYFDLEYFKGQIQCSLLGIVSDTFNRKFQVSLEPCKFNDGEGYIECC